MTLGFHGGLCWSWWTYDILQAHFLNILSQILDISNPFLWNVPGNSLIYVYVGNKLYYSFIIYIAVHNDLKMCCNWNNCKWNNFFFALPLTEFLPKAPHISIINLDCIIFVLCTHIINLFLEISYSWKLNCTIDFL